MNLENEEVSANEEVDDKWKEWKWMKTYRVWEANRKIFLWPENWIEPELRNDKSIFFKELENELMQNDITADTAEAAFLHYLDKVDEVTRLDICAMYHELKYQTILEITTQEQKTLVDILHVFGRTRGTPSKYYYRRRVNSAIWTSWEKVDLDIEGDHLIPVVRNRRLYLFWLIFTEKAREVESKEPSEGPPHMYWNIQLAWSEYKNKRWSPKKVSEKSLEDPNGKSSLQEYQGEKEDYFIRGSRHRTKSSG